MNQKNYFIRSGLLASVLLVMSATWGHAAGEDDKGYMLYTVQEGETLQFLAQRYLGGKQFLPELILYNALVTPNRVQAGDVIAIPMEIRDRALSQLKLAKSAIEEALEAQSDTFAPDEYSYAVNTLDLAQKARESAAYTRCIAMSDLVAIRAASAIEQADQKAKVQQPGILKSAFGQVEVSLDGGKSYSPATVGQKLDIPYWVKTDEKGRVEIELADKSLIQVQEGSILRVDDILYDQRDGLRRTRMKVVLGNILGRIAPKEHEDSTFDIETEAAAVAIRGTVLRVAADEEDNTRLSVLEGKTQLSANDDEVAVPEGFGSVSEYGKGLGEVEALLPAPRPQFPEADLITGKQLITFSWEAVKDKKTGSYHFELAKDPDFNEVIHRDLLGKTKVKSPVLEAGSYYWRVSTLSTRDLEGIPFDAYRLSVELRLAVDIQPDGQFWVDGNRIVLGKKGFLRLNAGEEDSSIEDFEIRKGQDEFVRSKRKVTLGEEGEYFVEVRGVTPAGTPGPAEGVAAWVDHSPPEVDVKLIPNEYSASQKRFKLFLQASDNTGVAKTEFRINGGAFRVYDGPVELDPFKSYDVSFRAEDFVGNQSKEKSIYVMSGWPNVPPPSS